MKFSDLSNEVKLQFINNTIAASNQKLYEHIVEKDWWVTQVLKALFSLPYAEHLSFKGGTSLSKCWHLIERFSEDIDIAISRDYLGYGGELSRTKISDKLRRAACSFVRETMQFDIREALLNQGIAEDCFVVNVHITPVSTTDPETIEINYKSALPGNEYIRPCVLIEVSGRSMQEPVMVENIQSFIDQYLPHTPVVEKPFTINNVVAPERTFLEKIFLLHEEFAKPNEEIRTHRMTRHLYDIVEMMQAGVAQKALQNGNLYRTIIEHRSKFINLKGFDYNKLYPATLTIMPPSIVLDLWSKDYEDMKNTMIYGAAPTFKKLLEYIANLQQTIRALPYHP